MTATTFSSRYVWTPKTETANTTGTTAQTIEVVYEQPVYEPRITLLRVAADRRRAKPRQGMARFAAYTDEERATIWVAAIDERAGLVYTMTPDEAYLLCCFLTVSQTLGAGRRR